MKIHVLGASCSGVTTLGEHLARAFNIPYFDSDQFFWEESDHPYTVRRNPVERNAMVYHHISIHSDWILGGSIIDWELEIDFDLVVFLWIPPGVRIERLKVRELEKFGDIIYTDRKRNKQFIEFINWSSGYDDHTARGRTLMAHENWMKELKCPVLEIRGDSSISERVKQVTLKMDELRNTN
jgi:adenylate kinase family enzyme